MGDTHLWSRFEVVQCCVYQEVQHIEWVSKLDTILFLCILMMCYEVMLYKEFFAFVWNSLLVFKMFMNI